MHTTCACVTVLLSSGGLVETSNAMSYITNNNPQKTATKQRTCFTPKCKCLLFVTISTCFIQNYTLISGMLVHGKNISLLRCARMR